jgi:heat shock protein HtpX
MARLGQLRLAMGTSIFLVAFIFAAFLALIMYIVDLSLIYAVIGTILFVLLQYLIGPSIVAVSSRLQYLKPGDNPWLETTVKELSEKSGIKMPRLAISPDNSPNAFVFGRTANSATLTVHEGLLKSLKEDEVRGVIGHELGHIKHKDYIVMTLLSALPLLAYIIARGTWQIAWFARGSSRDKNEGSMRAALFAVGAISYAAYIISLLFVMRLSRLREHYADAYSAYVTGSPRNLESALTKITYGLSLSSKPPSGARALYIADPAMAKQEIAEIVEKKDEYDLDHNGVLDERELEHAMEKEAKSTWHKINTWFSTHPPTFRRILLLREIEEEMQSGKYASDRIYAKV